MLYRRLTLSAPLPKTRKQFAHPLAILGLAATVLLALISAFPLQQLSRQLLSSDLNQSLAERYLVTVLKTNPDNLELRLTLVNQLTHQQKWDGAAQWLIETPAAQQNSVPYKIAQLDLNLARLQERLSLLEQSQISQTGNSSASDPPPMAKLPPEVRAILLSMRATNPILPLQIKQLAAIALHFHEESLALDFYSRLLREDSTLEDRWLAQQAQNALGTQNYRLAANLYFLAQQKAPLATARFNYLQKGIKTLQSANLLAEALAAGERYGQEFRDDRDFLIFMIRLALSANNPQLADQLSRRLMHLSWLEKITPFLQPSIRLASVKNIPETNPLKQKIRPIDPAITSKNSFDSEAYELTYHAFLANQNIATAYQVAVSAVQQVPQSIVWRERLAQLAEWSNNPKEALEQWIWLAKNQNQENAWQAIQRLAPGLFDHQALLTLYQHQIESQATSGQEDPALWKKTVHLYESLGEPATGLQYLFQLDRMYQNPTLSASGKTQLSTLIAELALRMGQTKIALTALQSLRRDGHSNEQLVLQEANLLYSTGRLTEAYQVLTSLPHPSPKATEYWQIRAELGRLTGDSNGAIAAYRTLHQQSTARLIDTLNFVPLLAYYSPQEAAIVAEQGWQHTNHPTLYLQALNYQAQTNNWPAMGALFAALEKNPDLEKKRYIENQSLYWQLKGQWLEKEHQWPKARASWEKALASALNAEDLQVTFLWLLIQQKDWPTLSLYLVRWRSNAEKSPRLAEVFTSAYYQLGLYETALHWAQKQLNTHRQDFLWLLYYADLLDLNHQNLLASHLRAALWQKRNQWSAPTMTPEKLTGLIRLALIYQPGEQAEALLRQALRQNSLPVEQTRDLCTTVANEPKIRCTERSNRSALSVHEDCEHRATQDLGRTVGCAEVSSKPTPVIDPSLKQPNPEISFEVLSDFALGYWLSQGHTEKTIAWLMSLHAQRLSAPRWVVGLQALQTEDRETLSVLLDQHIGTLAELPLYDHIQAAQLVGQTASAQNLAFSGLNRFPWDDQLHLQLFETTFPLSHRFHYGWHQQNDSIQRTQQQQLSLDWPLFVSSGLGSWQFKLEAARGRQSITTPDSLLPTLVLQQNLQQRLSDLPSPIASAPPMSLPSFAQNLTEQHLTLLHQNPEHPENIWKTQLGRYCHFICQTNAAVHYQTKFPRLLGELAFNWQNPSQENAFLRTFGQKNAFSTRWHWQLSKREYLSGQWEYQQHYLAGGPRIGAAQGLTLEVGHRLRIEYPDLNLRASYANWRFRPTAENITLAQLPVSLGTWRNLVGASPAYSEARSGGFVDQNLLDATTIPSNTLLPTSSETIALYLGFGHQLRQENHYSRAWRPLLDIGIGQNSASGLTWSALAGIAGSLIGVDHYVLYWSISQVMGQNTPDQYSSNRANKTNTFGLQYTYSFSH